jgi:putative ABC transport system substrate-binding protein
MERAAADALLTSDEGEHFVHRPTIVRLVAEERLPAIYPYREFVDVGGLIAYSTDLSDIFRRVAIQITDILKGTRPQDIPVYEPTKFELVVNIKTARSLGINVPPSILVSANEVIE